MTSKLKNLKGPPLLSVPGEDYSWATVMPGDAEYMNRALEKERTSGRGYRVASILSRMRTLGLSAKTKEGDEKMILDHLEKMRRKGDGISVANVLAQMRRIGYDVAIERGDKQLMWKKLQEGRENGDGHTVALMHLHLRSLNMPRKMSVIDRALIENDVDIASERNNRLYMIARKAMLGLPLTEDQARWVTRTLRERLSKGRREGDGAEIAESLVIARDVIRYEPENTALPPLKEYGKGR